MWRTLMAAKQRIVPVALLSLLLVGLTACSTIYVTTDYDPQHNFGQYKRYAWLDVGHREIKDPLVDNDLMYSRIKRAADQSLTARGFQKVASADADFLLNYHISVETKVDIDTFHSQFGYYPCWGCVGPRYGYGMGYDTDVHVRHYKSGSLMLDVIDPASKQLVWRGVVERRLNQGSPEERDQAVQDIVDAILAKFPPGQAAASE